MKKNMFHVSAEGTITLVILLTLGITVSRAAIFDTASYRAALSESELNKILVDGHDDTREDIVARFDFSDPDNLTKEATGGFTGGVNVADFIYGYETELPDGSVGGAAGGFAVSRPAFQYEAGHGSQADATDTMWIRIPDLPGDDDSVFWAHTGSADGGGNSDYRRAWINDDGSIEFHARQVASRGSGHAAVTSDPLEWEDGKWYFIAVVTERVGPELLDYRVYRAAQGDNEVQLLAEAKGVGRHSQSARWVTFGGFSEGHYGSTWGNSGHLGGHPDPDNNVENVHSPSDIEADPRKKALVQDGRATGAILIDRADSEDVLTAARDLQDILKKMTGVLVPLLTDAALDTLPEDALRIAVGPKMARRFNIEVNQDYTDGDYYLLLSREFGEEKSPVLVIAGNDNGERRGTNYAVFDFLRRLGCEWYGPDELWHVIPEYEELAIKPMRVEERASFGTMRNMRILTHFRGEQYRRLRDAWRNGGRRVAAGHSLGRSVLPREKYVDEHPEWFGDGQVNLTHPGAINQTIKELRERLDGSDAKRPVSIGIGAQDRGGWTDDERSREVGNISSQYLYFANRVARGLRETHPGEFQLVFYGYWFTHAPPDPMREAEPEIVVMFLHQGNKARSWVDPQEVDDYHGSNVRQLNHFKGWKETGAEMGIYNWWIPGFGRDEWKKVPWYKGQNAVDNLRLWHEHGVQVLEYETMRRDEIGDGFPIRWPLFYVAAQAFWNVDRDADDILREALENLYEDAAPPMFGYYKTLEKALTETELRASNWNLPSPEKIYTPEIREQASDYLEQAADAVPSGRPEQRLAQEKEIWEEALRIIRKLEEQEETVTYDLMVNGAAEMEVDDPMITEARIRSLLGIPEATGLIVVEPDGQTREIEEGEEYDLRAGIEFKTD